MVSSDVLGGLHGDLRLLCGTDGEKDGQLNLFTRTAGRMDAMTKE